jgi:hypothetical protein
MSTVAEIKEAISHLSESERRELTNWVLSEAGDFTDDGFEIEGTKAKLQAAAKGSFRKWTDGDWQQLHDSVK